MPHISGAIGDVWQIGMIVAAACGIVLWRRNKRLGLAFGAVVVGLLLLGGTGWL
jgi:hypothetical protein